MGADELLGNGQDLREPATTRWRRGAGSRCCTCRRTPHANAVGERLLGNIRRECLDHVLIFSETHLRRILNEYVRNFNRLRPHQGINQYVAEPRDTATSSVNGGTHVVVFTQRVPGVGWSASWVSYGSLTQCEWAAKQRMAYVGRTRS